MTLTEQWNKGKLPEGDYYIKRRNGYLLYDNIDTQGVWRNSIDEDIVEVIAPVPSYKEWQKLHQYTRNCVEEIKILREQLDVKNGMVDALLLENQQLKELLRECESVIRFENEYENEKLLTKIDNAIGEK